MRYYVIAGEKSGDLHGANLVRSIVSEDGQAQVRGIGGEQMQEAGVGLFIHFRQINFFGITEVLANLPTIFRVEKATKQDMADFVPDVLILIDFAGFNLRMAAFAKSKGIKVYYYISPKIWAWNTGRAHKIKRLVDRMFVILPFEVEFYKQFGYQVDYVGNPILDSITAFTAKPGFLHANGLGKKPIIALLPGSRKGEVEALLQLMVRLRPYFPEYDLVVAAVNSLPNQLYTGAEKEDVKMVIDQTYDLLSVAHSAVVASGTATLETGLFKVPQVVVYKVSYISYAIAKMLVKVRDIALVNLITDKIIVKTLLQRELTLQNLVLELRKTLGGPVREKILEDYEKLAREIGEPGASEKAGKLIVKYLRAS